MIQSSSIFGNKWSQMEPQWPSDGASMVSDGAFHPSSIMGETEFSKFSSVMHFPSVIHVCICGLSNNSKLQLTRGTSPMM